MKYMRELGSEYSVVQCSSVGCSAVVKRACSSVECSECSVHCESGERLCLQQGEAALQMHSFREADPQNKITEKYRISPK